jgi:hypothetical protein
MKTLIVLVLSVAAALASTPSAEAGDRGCGYGRGYSGHRHGGYHAPRYYAPRYACPPPVYYAPRYCAPRPVCPPPYYGYGYARPSVQFSFGYVGRPGYRW